MSTSAPPDPPTPRKGTRTAFALVGFFAGVVTVVIVVVLWKRFGG